MGRAAAGLAAACAVGTCTFAAVMVARRWKSRSRWNRAVAVVDDLESACDMPYLRLRHLVDAMAVEMHAGLASEGGSKLKMLLTFVDALPVRGEIGVFYAVHLSRSSLVFSRVNLDGKEKSVVPEVEERYIPSNLLSDPAEDLFDYVVESLDSFVRNRSSREERYPERHIKFGFCLSFPTRHQSISSAKLLKWTGDTELEDEKKIDVEEFLQRALLRKGLNMRLAALVNDTVGILTKAYYSDTDVMVAAILGQETNACYIERADAITKCQLTKTGSMVINMEWGHFWSAHLPWTSYDDELLCQSSSHNTEQSFGRLISGQYIGEIVRRIISRIAKESNLFGDSLSEGFSKPFILRTIPHILEMHNDDSDDLRVVGKIIGEHLGIMNKSLKLRRLVVKVCKIVVERAARLAAAGIVGILKKIGRDGAPGILPGRVRMDTSASRMKRTVVGIDGDLYKLYPKFRQSMQEAIVALLGEETSRHLVFQIVEDNASSIGTALIAASYSVDH